MRFLSPKQAKALPLPGLDYHTLLDKSGILSNGVICAGYLDQKQEEISRAAQNRVPGLIQPIDATMKLVFSFLSGQLWESRERGVSN